MTFSAYLKKIRVLLFCTILCVIPLVFDVHTTDVHFLIKSTIFRVLILLCTTISLCIIFLEKESRFPKEPFALIMFLYIAVGALSYMSVINNYFFLKKCIHVCSFFLLIINLILMKPSLKIIRSFFSVALITALIVTVIGIPEFWRTYLVDFSKYGFSMPIRCASTLGNPNFAMEYINIVIPISLALFFLAESSLISIVYGVIFSVFSVYVVLARCRSGWIAYTCMIIISQMLLYIFKKRHKFIPLKKMKIIAIAAVVIICILLCIPQVRTMAIPNFKTIFSTTFSSNAFRLLAWKSTIRMFLDHPIIGIGWGNFEPVYPKYRDVNEMIISGVDHRVGKAHNDFIQELAEGGILVFSLFIIMFFYIMHYCWKVMKHPQSSIHFYISFAAFLSYCATAITGFLGSSFQMPVSAIYFWFVTGCALSVYHLNFPVKNKIVFSKAFKVIIICCACVFAIIPLFISKYIISNMYLREALDMLAKGKHKQSLELLHVAHSYNRLEPETIFYIGMASANTGNFEDSIKYYSLFLESQPYFAECANNIGVGYDNLKDYENAEKYYRKAISLKPNFSDAYNNLGAVLNAQKKFDDALKNYRFAVKYSPTHYRALNNIGILLSNKGEKEKARQYFEQALKIEPRFLKAAFNLGNYYSEKDDWQRVEKIFSQITDNNFRKNYSLSLYKNGLAYYQRKDFKKAYRMLKLSAYLSGFSEQYFYLGCTAVFLNKWDEALNFARGSLKIKNDFVPSYALVAALYQHSGKMDLAKEYYKPELKNTLSAELQKRFSDVLFKNGTFFHSIQQYAFSVPLLSYSVLLHKHPDNYNNLIVAYINSNNADIALKTCNNAIADFPQYYKFYVNKAIIYERKGDVDNAIETYKNVILHGDKENKNTAKEYLQVVYNRCAANYMNTDPKKAAEYLQELINVDPSSKAAAAAKKQLTKLKN